MRVKLLLIPLSVSFSLYILACGGGKDTRSEPPKAPDEEANAVAVSGMTSTIFGTVHFRGTIPKRRRIKQDKECSVLHAEPVYSQTIVVNENGTLRYVFVYVKEGLGDRKFTPPAEPVVFDQRGCMYEPHVFGIQTGQKLKILNSDPLLHNIHALSKKNRPFNFGMPRQGDVRERSFKRPEIMVRIKCDVHPWMGAYTGVLDHPYYSVTDETGTFKIDHLPPGEYVIEAWHEKYGTMTKMVTIEEDEEKTIDFTYGED